MEQLQAFLDDPQGRIFVLKGYAGTGKTTLIRSLCLELERRQRLFALLATTGRAAKVLQNKTRRSARTIHSQIYAFDEVGGMGASSAEPKGQLSLNFSLKQPIVPQSRVVYVVDEASMITHELAKEGHTARFGSGSLLTDLLEYGKGARFVFVGDPCQLPPIADNPFSSALMPSFLSAEYGLPVVSTELQEVIRQKAQSEILQAADQFRECVIREVFEKYPKLPAGRGKDLSLYKNHHLLVKAYARHIQKHGFQSAIMIAWANWQVNQLNRKIRKLLYPSWELQLEELLMIVQNSYITELANGDQVVLKKVRFEGKRAGFTFLRVRVKALHDGSEHEALMIRELLYNERSGLSREEVQRLLIDFDKRMRAKGVKRKSAEYEEAMRSDPWLNALRAKFGYAITCHKAQGGEWEEVYLNIHKSLYALKGPQLYRWYYTALTRARRHLHVNDGWWVQGFHSRKSAKS